MALDMAKFLARFVEEARDHLVRLNAGLVRLENNPDDAETINAVFRSAHTIKGSSRMMKLVSITEVAHKLEDALGAMREKKLSHSKELADVLFKGIDCIAGMIEKVAAGHQPDADMSAICNELAKAAEGQFVSTGSAVSEHTGAKVPADKPASPLSDDGRDRQAVEEKTAGQEELQNREKTEAPRPSPENKPSASVRVNAETLDELIRLMGEIVSNQNRLKQRLADVREAEKAAKRNAELTGYLEGDGNDLDGKGREIIEAGHALQVRLKKLASAIRDDGNIQELLTNELQEKALVLRMVPLSTIFDSLQRTARDVARSQDKDVELAIGGGDIGLDKKMIEKLGDPLMHMLRNSIDHGIESPEQRRNAGKRERGMVKLSASYDAGSVLIEMRDDGGGLRLDKIREKALRKKMFTEEELNAMSEAGLRELIFQPGFSTSPFITDISGRGVGLDVVKRNIVEELKGSIAISSKAGKGTSFSLRLPMTLAVMRVVLVEASGMTFAITAHYVTEIIRVPASEIITVLNKKALRLREEFIPVADLRALLKLNGGGEEKSTLLLIITRVGAEKLGLIADVLLDEEDMVIKALPPHMKNIHLVSGVTISGRNEIVSILHVPGLIKAAAEMQEARAPEKEMSGAARILVVDDSINTRDIEKSILEAYGYTVDVAEDGIEAVEKARATSYDLIITDVEMPRLDGFSLTERLRGDASCKDTPIIIMTSREKEEDKKRGIQVGANAYIVKGSFDQGNLLETVQNLIG
jgi:chemotaxis protein histidine kinase CheA